MIPTNTQSKYLKNVILALVHLKLSRPGRDMSEILKHCGIIEGMLVLYGVVTPSAPLPYAKLAVSKKTETYPELMLRLGMDLLEKLNQNNG